MWEALGAIPPGMEAEFHDEIKKRIKIQEQYLKDQWAYTAEIYQPYSKFVPPKSFIMSCTEIRELQSKVQAECDAEKDSAIDSAVFENEKYSDKRLRDYYERTGKRFWCLSLCGISIVKLYEAESYAPIENSDLVYKAIMDCLLLRRSPQTPLETPDGTIHYLKEYMPGLRVRVEELGYADKTAATIIATVTTKLLCSLYTICNTNDSNEVIVNPEMGDGGE
ncbi:hypothetical protein MFIFM68171_10030 [Madurella fahalii]|uniref:Uncharacterized protein n=1 Tax=Madurella fahalii TaxID=1157608 RepID=A0ABQ0GQ04_9PEZI